MSSLDFRYDHWYVDDLPGDPDERNVRRQVAGAAWTRTEPTSTALPQLIAHSPETADLLGIDPVDVATEQFARGFSGNEILDGMVPMAMNYGGHQFGNWAGQLGDGRAIALGEINTRSDSPVPASTETTDENVDAGGGASHIGSHQMLQLKGAGYAAIFCLVAVFAIWFLYGVGLLLPEESRETEDPTPFSYNLIVEDTAQV